MDNASQLGQHQKVIVLGSTGMLGTALTHGLAFDGYHVTAVDRSGFNPLRGLRSAAP
jgi:nucleoside-diphosphate-sugar epimerase